MKRILDMMLGICMALLLFAVPAIATSGGTDGNLLRENEDGDSLTSAQVTAAADSVAGTWIMSSAEADGIIITDTDTLGIELNVLLKEDGTGMIISNQGNATCSWTKSGSTVTVMSEGGDPLSCTLQPDGTLAWVIEDVTVFLNRTDNIASAEAPQSSESAVTVSEYGFSVQLPKGWVAIDDEYIAQIVESVGEEIASANGFDESLLDQLDAASTSMYYLPDSSSNFAVVREPAGDVTMDNFASLELSFQENFRNGQGITDFKLSGPVEINGKQYYVGTFTGLSDLEQQQYFSVANGYIYTITMTNVSDSDTEQIMGSFEIL